CKRWSRWQGQDRRLQTMREAWTWRHGSCSANRSAARAVSALSLAVTGKVAGGATPQQETKRVFGRVAGNTLRRVVAIAGFGALLSLGAPAAAQTYSDGHKFLEAVKKRDSTTVDELLGKPGSTLVNSRDLSNGRTALHIAVDRRDQQWITFQIGRAS